MVRDKQIKIRVTALELLEIQSKSAKFGIPLSTYARDILLNESPQKQKSTRLLQAKYLSQIAWIGNNFNQTARALNVLKNKDFNGKSIECLEQLTEICLRLSVLQDEFKYLNDTLNKECILNDSQIF